MLFLQKSENNNYQEYLYKLFKDQLIVKLILIYLNLKYQIYKTTKFNTIKGEGVSLLIK